MGNENDMGEDGSNEGGEGEDIAVWKLGTEVEVSGGSEVFGSDDTKQSCTYLHITTDSDTQLPHSREAANSGECFRIGVGYTQDYFPQ